MGTRARGPTFLLASKKRAIDLAAMLLMSRTLAAFLMVLSHTTATASAAASRKHGTQQPPARVLSLPARCKSVLRFLSCGPVLFVVGDDVGYADFGYFNDQKTITPTVDELLATGIHLADYCTRKRRIQAQPCA